MRAPRFAIEATNLADSGATGVARYTRCLVEALATLELPPADDFELVQFYKNSHRGRAERMATGRRLSARGWRGRLWPLLQPDVDLIHVPDDRIPPWRMPMVATIYDLYAALHINYTDEAKRRQKVQIYERLRDRCARLVCISEHTRQDFLRLVGGDPERLKVVHLGVSDVFRPHGAHETAPVLQRLRIAGPYLFFVGATANKNLARTIDAFAASAARRDHRLVAAGKLGPVDRAALESRIAALGIGDRVDLLGYVDDADLPALHAGASGYLFPSLYEGYGLPILEAMASGTPVVTSDRSSCPEVAAGHAVIVDPEDIEALAHGIDEALRMSPERRDAARAYAATRTWARTARETLDIWRDVIARG